MAHFLLLELGENPLFDAAQIEAMIAPSLQAMGYSVVRVSFTGGRRPTLQIMAERNDEQAMTVDDCATISHSVSALLDVADPIATAYHLEISSPGIDRPLVRPGDYARFAGFEAKIELQRPIEGRRRFRGKLLGVAADSVKLLVGDQSLVLPLSSIARAKLVLSDALIAGTQSQNRS
jgi:ribosome maturation factor RimP